MDKRYPCIPGSSFLTVFYCYGLVFYSFMMYFSFSEGEVLAGLGFVCFFLFTFAVLVWSWQRTMRKVRFEPDRVVCFAPLCRDIIIEFERCNLGFDYHVQHGRKVWWIYLCYGPKPAYKPTHPGNRINALKCREGFVRILYRDDVYAALLAVLPKRQAEALRSARKFTDLD